MTNILKPKIFISIFFLILIAGCGYTTKTLVPTKYKTIYVETFKNKIDITQEVSQKDPFKVYRPFLEVDITNAVIDRFIYDGNLTVTKDSHADLILTGNLMGFVKQPLKYADSDEIEEYRLNLVVDFAVKGASDEKIILEAKNLVGDTTYFTTGTLAKTEETALVNAIDDLARRIVERTVEFW